MDLTARPTPRSADTEPGGLCMWAPDGVPWAACLLSAAVCSVHRFCWVTFTPCLLLFSMDITQPWHPQYPRLFIGIQASFSQIMQRSLFRTLVLPHILCLSGFLEPWWKPSGPSHLCIFCSYLQTQDKRTMLAGSSTSVSLPRPPTTVQHPLGACGSSWENIFHYLHCYWSFSG